MNNRGLSISLAVLVCVLWAGAAYALDLTVTSTASDASAGSLRAAITAVNAAGGGTITLAGQTITLTAPDNYWYGPNGLPPISSAITIEGNGAVITRSIEETATLLNAAGTRSLGEMGGIPFRFFYVAGGGAAPRLPQGTLTLKNLTLSNGWAQGGNGAGGGGGGAGLGGAIFNQGSLTMVGVTLTGNIAAGGNGGDVADSDGGGGGGGLGGDGGNTYFGDVGGEPAGGGGGGGFGGNGGNAIPDDEEKYGGGAGGGGFAASNPGSDTNTDDTMDTDTTAADGSAGGGGLNGDLGGAGGAAYDDVNGGAGGSVSAPNSGGGGGGGYDAYDAEDDEGVYIGGPGGSGGFGGGGGGGGQAEDRFVISSGAGGAGGVGGGGGGGGGSDECDIDSGGGNGGNGGFGGGGGCSGYTFDWEFDSVSFPVGGNGGFGGGGGGGGGEGGGGGGGGGGDSELGDATAGEVVVGAGGVGGFGGGSGDTYGDGGGGAGLGGAIFNDGGTLAVTNCTLTGNTAQGGTAGTNVDEESGGAAVGGSGYGGAIFSRDGMVSLLNCTLASNTVVAGVGGDGESDTAGNSDGGAVYNYSDYELGTITLANVILAYTTGGRDFVNDGGTVTATEPNLVQNTAFTGKGVSFITGDPLLAALANNGGPTQTMALTAGSPAINTADSGSAPVTDQRGYYWANKASLGAYEFSGVDFGPPTITGTVAGQTVNDNAAIAPFSGVTIGNADAPAQTLAVSVQLDNAGKGTFTVLNGFTSAGGGLYTFSGTAAAATTAIRGLVFAPTPNRMALGLTETTIFTISVSDGVLPAVQDSNTTVIVTEVTVASTTQTQTLPLFKLIINLSQTPGNDSIRLCGSLLISNGLALAGQEVLMNVGGVVKVFTLDKNGGTPKGNDYFKLNQRKTVRDGAALQTARFTAVCNKGSFASTLAAYGLSSTAAHGSKATVPVTVVFNGILFQKSVVVTNPGNLWLWQKQIPK